MKSGENGLIGPGDNNYGSNKPRGFFSRKDHGGFPPEFLKEQLKKAINNMKTTQDTPRRIRLYLNVPAELAITNAIQEIEKLGADVRLTDAEILMQKAKDLVSDYIDEQFKMQKETEEKYQDSGS